MTHTRPSWLRTSLCTSTWSLIALASVAGVAPDPQLQRLEEPTSSQVIAGTQVVGDVDARTLRAALEALPSRPDRIVLVGAQAIPPAFARQMQDVDGFVPVGSRVIYLRREGATL